MGKKVVIFGVGDFARMAYVYLTKDSPYEVAAFTVNERYLPESRNLFDLPVVPFETLEKTHPVDQYEMLAAVGYKRVNQAREEVYLQCKAKGYRMITYVHSKSVLTGFNEIGENTFIFENNVIQPFVKIGNNVVIWSGNHIGHDSTIEDHCFIASHVVISGNTTIGRRTFVGVNATFRDAIRVAPDCVIGAGAIILKDTRERGVYVGRNTEALEIPSNELRSFQ